MNVFNFHSFGNILHCSSLKHAALHLSMFETDHLLLTAPSSCEHTQTTLNTIVFNIYHQSVSVQLVQSVAGVTKCIPKGTLCLFFTKSSGAPNEVPHLMLNWFIINALSFSNIFHVLTGKKNKKQRVLRPVCIYCRGRAFTAG